MMPAPGGHDPKRANVMALLLLAALLAGGFLLFRALRADVAVERCIESGRRDCAPLDR
jgi:hypothetical protein